MSIKSIHQKALLLMLKLETSEFLDDHRELCSPPTRAVARLVRWGAVWSSGWGGSSWTPSVPPRKAGSLAPFYLNSIGSSPHLPLHQTHVLVLPTGPANKAPFKPIANNACKTGILRKSHHRRVILTLSFKGHPAHCHVLLLPDPTTLTCNMDAAAFAEL